MRNARRYLFFASAIIAATAVTMVAVSGRGTPAAASVPSDGGSAPAVAAGPFVGTGPTLGLFGSTASVAPTTCDGVTPAPGSSGLAAKAGCVILSDESAGVDPYKGYNMGVSFDPTTLAVVQHLSLMPDGVSGAQLCAVASGLPQGEFA